MSDFRDVATDIPVTERELGHHGWVWNLVSERFDYAGTELQREFIDHTGAVAVLALDEHDRALFIRQYRHPIRARDWELPAGLLDDPNESALETAKRELAEEADLQATDWSLLLDFWTSPGGSSESIRIYLARGVAATTAAFERVHEEADIETKWVALEDALDAVLRGDVHNPAALQAIFAANESKRRNWSTLRDASAPWPTRPDWPSTVPKALAGGARA